VTTEAWTRCGVGIAKNTFAKTLKKKERGKKRENCGKRLKKL